jgi:hypothetical protein
MFLFLLAPAALLVEELRKMLTRKLPRVPGACLPASKQKERGRAINEYR